MAAEVGLAAGIVGLIKLAQSVLSVCYDYNAVRKGASREVSRVRDEVEGLRIALQALEPLIRNAEFADPAAGTRLPTLASLCAPDGVLQSCRTEMQRLEEKIKPPGWSDGFGPKRKALLESMRWPFKEKDTNKIVERLGRFKDILGLAMSADDT